MIQPQIIIAPEPFTPRVERLELPSLGQNVAQVLAAACNQGKLAVDDLERVRVYVDGVDLQAELGDGWLDYVPTAGDIVNVAVDPLGGGGGGGGNKVLQTILTIAIVALSFYVGGGAATPGLLDGIVFRTAAAAAVNVGGQMILAAAFKPDRPEKTEEANARGALQGSANNYRLRAPMPLALGAQRYAFDLAAGAYTSMIGEDVYLTVMFGLHYGPVALSDLKIGETLADDYPAGELVIEQFLAPGPRSSTLYPARVIQANYDDELESGGAGDVHTTATDAERIEVDIALPGGLSYTNEKGKFLEAGAHYIVEFQEVGSDVWTPAPLPPAVAPSGPLPPGSIYVQRASRDPVRTSASFEVPKGQYNVRVTFADNAQEDGEGTLVNNSYWTALRTIENGSPVLDENLSLLVLRIKSSGDLNGNLPVVSGVLEPIVPVWNGADWATTAPSSNAAALARWLLTGPAAAVPLPAEQIHSSVVDAYELIEANNWKGAIDLRDETSQRDALVMLGKMGRFSTYWNGRALCFVTDWEKPAPRQVFSGRNAGGYRYRRNFPDPIHAVIVEFSPLSTVTPGDELFVYADGYDETNAELLETYRLDFACDHNRAYREGRAYLAKRQLQVEVHEWQAGIDAVATTYGDRVLVRHPATLYGLAEATVDHRIFQGALVAGLKLDSAVTMTPGGTYGLDIRRADSVIRGVAVQNPNTGKPTRKLMFAAPRAVDDAPERGDLVIFGETDVITEDLELLDVEASAEGTVTFRGMRYIADALEQAETGPIPPFDSGLAPRSNAPVPRIIGANGSPDGVTVTFDIDPLRSALLTGFKVRMRRSAIEGSPNGWTALPDLGAGERFVRTPPITDAASPPEGDVLTEYRIDVEIRSRVQSGAISNPGKAYSILVRRGVPPVVAFLAQGLAIEAPDGSKYPAIVVTAQEMEAGVVQDLNVELRPHGGPADAWRSAGAPIPANNPRGEILDVDSGRSYDVRARWRSSDNWFGPWATRLDVLVPVGSRVAYAAATVGGLTPEEVQELLEQAAAIGAGLSQSLKDLASASLEHSSRIDADVRYMESLTHLAGKPFAAVIIEEREIRESADEALARVTTLLGAVIGDYEAFLLDELLVQVRPGESLASWRTQLEAADADTLALYEQEVITRTNADNTFASYFSFLGAKRPGQDAWNLAEGSVFLEDGSSFGTYRTQTAASIGTVSAAVSTETSARISGDTANATAISNLSATVAGWSGSITTLQSVTSGLGAEHTLSLNVNGHISGVRNYNNGYRSSFIVSASEIGFSNGASTLYPLAIIGGVVRASQFEADRVKAGSIVADSVQANNINETVQGVGGGQSLPNGNDVTVAAASLFIPRGKVTMRTLVRISNAGGETTAAVSLRRNGAEIASYTEFGQGAWGDNFHMFEVDDSPTGGLTHTYSIVVTRNTAGGGPLTCTQARVTIENRKTES